MKKYTYEEENKLLEKYREKGIGSTGKSSGIRLYRRGIKFAKISEYFDNINYEYYYDAQEHWELMEKLGYAFFKKAAKCFKKSAEHGNDISAMNYALYLITFKDQKAEALQWFLKASELGLATADYQLYSIYKNGYCSVEKNEETAESYLVSYRKRIAEDERQMFLAWDIDENVKFIGKSFMFSWFSGISCSIFYDTPEAKPSRWKYGD